jgi:predicted Fe-Mo cluster-binding NifX family protein
MTAEIPARVAVAEGEAGRAPALGRALRFVVFDILDGAARSPCYRVRHDQPGEACEGHAELISLLADCQVVIAGAAGPRLTQRLRASGIEVATTSEARPAAELVARHLAGFKFHPTTPQP